MSDTTYKCDQCNNEIEIDKKDIHDMYCLYTPQMKEYQDLIPCEICQDLISFDVYQEHIDNCRPRTSFVNRAINIGNLVTNIISTSGNLNIPILPLSQTSIINESHTPTPNETEVELQDEIDNELEEQPISEAETEEDSLPIETEDTINTPESNLNLDHSLSITNVLDRISNLYDVLGVEPNIGFSDNVGDMYNILNNNTDNYENLMNLSSQIGVVSNGIEPDLVSKIINKVTVCPICKEEVEEIRNTKCNHDFCVECLSEWLRNNKTCPICMKMLDECV